jgi:AraC-like DNA-binding protein
MQEFPIDLHKNDKKPKTEQNAEEKDINEADYRAMHVKRTSFIEKLITDSNGNCNGRRDKLLFVWYNHAIKIMDTQTAIKKLHKLNKSFTEPLRESEIKNIIVSRERYGHRHIKTATFFELCECTLKQRMEYTSNSQRELEREDARKRKSQRNAEIFSLKAQGLSIRKIAQTVGCSPTTVQTVLKSEPIPCPTAEKAPEEQTTATTTNDRTTKNADKEPTTKVINLTVAELAVSDYRSAPTGCYCGEPQRSPEAK